MEVVEDEKILSFSKDGQNTPKLKYKKLKLL